MERKYKLYGPEEADFKLVWDDYEKFFGVRPPPGHDLDDYWAAMDACETANSARMLPDLGLKPEPVAEWPSQKRVGG